MLRLKTYSLFIWGSNWAGCTKACNPSLPSVCSLSGTVKYTMEVPCNHQYDGSCRYKAEMTMRTGPDRGSEGGSLGRGRRYNRPCRSSIHLPFTSLLYRSACTIHPCPRLAYSGTCPSVPKGSPSYPQLWKSLPCDCGLGWESWAVTAAPPRSIPSPVTLRSGV